VDAFGEFIEPDPMTACKADVFSLIDLFTTDSPQISWEGAKQANPIYA
jgi:hypothetical protein